MFSMASGGTGSVVDRDDVHAVLTALFDIRTELRLIRRALEDGDGEEEEEADFS
jgi:hypothetical protein